MQMANLTDQQRQAVVDRGGKLLVSAAAGSGKTMVLVERLMSYILDPIAPANIDDFLIITYTKAAAAELRYHPTTRNATSILHLRMGETPAVTLFLRTHSDEPLSPFAPAACGGGLSETFRAYTQDASPHTKAWWQQIAAFLADACRFITPDCVVVETDRPRVSLPIRPEMFPRSTRVIRMRYALNTPSLAHRGAVRLNRRILWDSMMGDSPEYTL